MKPGELVEHLRVRPRMFLPDDRYETMVAFVSGFDAAVDGTLLREFSGWCLDRWEHPESGFHWSALIRERALSCESDRTVNLSSDPDASVKSLLLDLLQQFFEEKDRSGKG
ncbi:hypothetical protein ABZ815_51860 [Nonomuraea sp. NPDC047529]|uniref:hypothetical protein n=1 Tax=Nonomuraea sp. NPDC047529 TaxID=3155623 RepID=UPI0034015BBA